MDEHAFRTEAARLGVEDAVAVDQLLEFANLLRQWNTAMNLVSRRDVHRVLERHVLDSLRCLSHLDTTGGLLDIGSGGGFPGLVLAIAERRRPVVLLDRSVKKCRYLARVGDELGLDNLAVVCGDAADHRPEQPYGFVTSRAVADVETVWRWCQPLLREAGKLIHMTGEQHITTRVRAQTEAAG